MSSIYRKIEKKARSLTPSFLAPAAKTAIAYPRYYSQLQQAKKGYTKYHDRYGQHILYVAGLPKSGTTWLEKMLSSFPGFTDIMIPGAVAYEQKHGESHTFDFPPGLFSRFNNALVVLKLHAHGSPENFLQLQQNQINYVVLYRDLRDVAVSHVFYVQHTAYHPEHTIYKGLTIKQALLHFGNTLLPQFVQWVDSWYEHDHSPYSYMLRYEDLVNDPFEKLGEVAKHYKLNAGEEDIRSIIEKNSFESLSGGRTKGADDNKSFFRKGISGDWKNYFDEEVTALFNQHSEAFNQKYGY